MCQCKSLILNRHKTIEVWTTLNKFNQDIFADGTLEELNLIPIDDVVKNGVVQTPEISVEGIDTWIALGELLMWVRIILGCLMAYLCLKQWQSLELFSKKKVRPGSILPEISVSDLPRVVLE